MKMTHCARDRMTSSETYKIDDAVLVDGPGSKLLFDEIFAHFMSSKQLETYENKKALKLSQELHSKPLETLQHSKWTWNLMGHSGSMNNCELS